MYIEMAKERELSAQFDHISVRLSLLPPEEHLFVRGGRINRRAVCNGAKFIAIDPVRQTSASRAAGVDPPVDPDHVGEFRRRDSICSPVLVATRKLCPHLLTSTAVRTLAN